MADPELIKLIESAIGLLPEGDTGKMSLYHDLGIWGDDADELLEAYADKFGVEIAPFRWTDYFPNEGNPVWELLKNLFRARKEYKRLTIADLQRGIENKELEL
jgi:hypothetical protein